MSSNKHSRRDFLRTAIAALSVPYVIPRSVLAATGRPGANDRIRTAVIGTGSRIHALINQSQADLQLVAMADCFLPRAPALAQWAAKARPDLCPDADEVAIYQRALIVGRWTPAGH